jgi:5-methylcytosine-specific restriction endonuclease McrA
MANDYPIRETLDQAKNRIKRDLEVQVIQLRAQLLSQPLNSSIKDNIKRSEDCLKQNYPDSEVIKNEPEIKPEKKCKPKTITDGSIKKKKKSISATVKRLVWNTNIGEDIGKTKCMCCKSTDITQMSFNCGHIIAETNGGETIVSNLKPICQNCNSSMGTKNMNEFMISLK